MTGTKNFSASQRRKNVLEQLPLFKDTDGTPIKRMIKDCPWGSEKSQWLCNKFPEHFICNNPDCWRIGHFFGEDELRKIGHVALFMIIETAELYTDEELTKLRKHYQDQHNHPGPIAPATAC